MEQSFSPEPAEDQIQYEQDTGRYIWSCPVFLPKKTLFLSRAWRATLFVFAIVYAAAAVLMLLFRAFDLELSAEINMRILIALAAAAATETVLYTIARTKAEGRYTAGYVMDDEGISCEFRKADPLTWDVWDRVTERIGGSGKRLEFADVRHVDVSREERIMILNRGTRSLCVYANDDSFEFVHEWIAARCGIEAE